MPKKQTNRNGSKAKSRRNNNAGTKPLATRGLASALMQLNENRRPNTVNPSHLRGSDFITAVNTSPSSSASGTIIASFPISPSAYPGTRLTSLSQLWERFRFTSLNLRYVPAVPMTIACQFIIYIDTDPLDDPNTLSNPNAILRQATAQAKSQQFNFNKAKTISLCIRKDDQLYYTGADKQNLRFSNQGTAYIIQVTDVLDFNGATLSTSINAGSIYLDWNVCFDIPQINPSALLMANWDGGGDRPSSYLNIKCYENGVDVLAGATGEPNRAYLAVMHLVQADLTAVTTGGQVEVEIETSVPNTTAVMRTGTFPGSFSSHGQVLVFTGPDGLINISYTNNTTTTAAEIPTGLLQIIFTPVSF